MAAKSTARDTVPVPRRRTGRRPPWVRRLKIALALFCFLMLCGVAVGGFEFIFAMKWAESQLGDLPRRLNQVDNGMTVMYARDGKTKLYTASAETRMPVDKFEDIPKNVVNATLAAEDKRFFKHSGVDYYALGRSVVTDVRERRSAQGGSTITMQLVKRLYTSTEKSLTRKLRDVALAIQIEKQLRKEDILKDYLNQVYYGQGAYGIKAASTIYFNKPDLSKLTVGEAALLARLVRRPSDENPYKAPKKAISNRNDVLGTELQEGWISKEQYDKAMKEKLRLAPKRFGSGEQIFRAPYFVRYVLDVLHKDLPEVDFKSGGYVIETTLDPDMEVVTEKAVKDVVTAYRRRKVTTGAFLLCDAQGEILAMVGGTDFEKHQYNAISQGRRQPGSSFKPIVYSTALSLGELRPGDYISGGEFFYNDPYSGKTWNPQNDNGPTGMISIRTALAQSINTAAVRVIQKTGPENVVQYAHSIFGYTSKLSPVLSLCLGTSAVSPMEQAQAYSIFQSHGDRATPFGISRVTGPNGDVLKAYGPDIRPRLLDPDVAAQMDTYLRAVVTEGTATRASVVPDARGKTGTTQDNRDAWFCGYTNNFIGIGWVANEKFDKNQTPPYYYDPMPGIFGGHVPTEIWVKVMLAAQKKFGKGAPQPPKHLERNDVYVDTSAEKPIKLERTRDKQRDYSLDRTDNNVVRDRTPAAPDEPADNTGQQVDTGNQPTPPPVDAPAPEKPRRRRDRSNSRVTETVSVEICSDSGQLATSYCPETVTRTYIRGEEPRRYCTKHGP